MTTRRNWVIIALFKKGIKPVNIPKVMGRLYEEFGEENLTENVISGVLYRYRQNQKKNVPDKSEFAPESNPELDNELEKLLAEYGTIPFRGKGRRSNVQFGIKKAEDRRVIEERENRAWAKEIEEKEKHKRLGWLGNLPKNGPILDIVMERYDRAVKESCGQQNVALGKSTKQSGGVLTNEDSRFED